MRKVSLIFLLFLISCGANENSSLIENCGEKPVDFIEIEIGNDPNFVFQNDPGFQPILLNDTNSNSAIVNSYQECIHYVKGGWYNPASIILETKETSGISQFLLIFISLIFLFVVYLNFKHFQKEEISNKNIANYVPLLFFSLALFNVAFKIFKRGIYFSIFSETQILKYISVFLSLLFFYFVIKLVNHSFNLNSYSLSLSYYLTSFFLIDIVLLPFTRTLAFGYIVLIVNLLWLAVLIYRKSSFVLLVSSTLSYCLLNLFNNHFLKILSDVKNYKILNADVEKQWFPIVESIHNNNLYYALDENLIDGYGMLLSYLQAVIHKLNHINSFYTFMNSDSYLILMFSLFLFYDLKISRFNKVLLLFSFFLIVLDDGWLRFLLGDSLMLEGLVSFLFASFLMNLNNHFLKSNSYSKKIFFIVFFVSLTFSKQFIETLTWAILILILLLTKERLKLLYGLGLILLSQIYKRLFFGNSNSIEYFDGSWTEVILNILSFRDAEWKNLRMIFLKLFEFKFITFAIIVVFLFHILNFKRKKGLDRKILFYSIGANLALIIILYLYIWKNVEIDSSFRYIINTVHIIFISLFLELDEYQKKKQLY